MSKITTFYSDKEKTNAMYPITRTKAIYDDNNVNLEQRLNEAMRHTVIETWTDGTNWYRVWSDGWLEQGGVIPPLSDQVYTVTYMLPFQDLTYYAHNTMEWAGAGNADWRYMCCYNRTTTSFQTFTQASTQKTWYACGQGV